LARELKTKTKSRKNQIVSEQEISIEKKIVKAGIVAVGADNTTDRRFRQLERNILWSCVDFFLTSFPVPTILPNQTRGENWFDDDLLPGIDQPSNGPDYTENLEGRNPTSHRASQFLARLSWAFLFFRLGRRN
jgi:hypothetical protein